MSDLYIEARLQAIKEIASASCSDIKDADNIAGFCDEIYSAIPKLDKIIEELELHSFELGTDTLPVHYVRLNDAIEIVKQGIEDIEAHTKFIENNANIAYEVGGIKGLVKVRNTLEQRLKYKGVTEK